MSLEKLVHYNNKLAHMMACLEAWIASEDRDLLDAENIENILTLMRLELSMLRMELDKLSKEST